jgi:hypothetical protein
MGGPPPPGRPAGGPPPPTKSASPAPRPTSVPPKASHRTSLLSLLSRADVIAQGDRTHIPASSQPIYDILSSELGRVKQASHPVCPSLPHLFPPQSFLLQKLTMKLMSRLQSRGSWMIRKDD